MKKRVKEIFIELRKLEAAKEVLRAELHFIQKTCKHDFHNGGYVCKHCEYDSE